MKNNVVSNTTLADRAASLDLGPGVQGGLTGFMILPYKTFSFTDGMPASPVSTPPVSAALYTQQYVRSPAGDSVLIGSRQVHCLMSAVHSHRDHLANMPRGVLTAPSGRVLKVRLAQCAPLCRAASFSHCDTSAAIGAGCALQEGGGRHGEHRGCSVPDWGHGVCHRLPHTLAPAACPAGHHQDA